MRISHALKMLLGCMLPLVLLLVVLPAFGVSGNWQFLIAALAMVACHVFMMGGHRHDEGAESDQKGAHHEQA